MVGCSMASASLADNTAFAFSNPAMGISLKTAIIPAAVALAALIILFVTDRVRKSKGKK